jgi:ABC-type transport system involved in cytochrome c biogenesis permease subunit
LFWHFSKCTKSKTLSPVAIATIAMVIVLVCGVGLVISTIMYRGKARKTRELGVTQNYLEMTECLLADEKEENRMLGQAWSINESDLAFGETLGVGAFGLVVEGMWG